MHYLIPYTIIELGVKLGGFAVPAFYTGFVLVFVLGKGKITSKFTRNLFIMNGSNC
jgi:hypothetical protein